MLTEKQKKMVEENHGLIYGFAKQHRLDLDVWYNVLAEALCIAATTWREDGGAAFSTYVYRKMWGYKVNSIRNQESIKKSIPKDKLLYGDSQWYETGETLFDKLEDDRNSEDEAVTRVVVSQYVSELDDRDRKIFFMMVNEVRQEDMARQLGICQSYVSRRQRKIRKELKERLCL